MCSSKSSFSSSLYKWNPSSLFSTSSLHKIAIWGPGGHFLPVSRTENSLRRPKVWLCEMRGFKVGITPRRDMNYSYVFILSPPFFPQHNHFRISSPALNSLLTHDTFSITFDKISPTSHPCVQFIGSKAREVRFLRVITSPFIPPKYTRAGTQTLCPRPAPPSQYGEWYRHTHTQTTELRFLICALFPLSHHLCWGCCKSGLSSVSKVWASVVSLFSTPSGSSSPAGESMGGALIYFIEYYFLSFMPLPWQLL